MTAEQIAASLTEAQRAALRALTDQFRRAANRVGWRNQADYEFKRINASAEIVERTPFDGGFGYRLTPLGIEVRAILERQSNV